MNKRWKLKDKIKKMSEEGPSRNRNEVFQNTSLSKFCSKSQRLFRVRRHVSVMS